MPRVTCSRCQGPREADSSSLSWCKECIRTYQRNRYRNQMKDAGKAVTPRKTTSPRNTAEGFEDHLQAERQRSRALIKFYTEIQNSALSVGEQSLQGHECDLCQVSMLTRENCNPVARQWLTTNPTSSQSILHTTSSSQMLVPASDTDPRAVHLIVGLVCNNCNSLLEFVRNTPFLQNAMAYFKQNVQAFIPEDAPEPSFMQPPPTQPQPPSIPANPPTTKTKPPKTTHPTPKFTPPEYPSSTSTSTPIPLPEPPWMSLSDEEIRAYGQECFDKRLDEATAQWYEGWTYYMQKRNMQIPEELFDEDCFMPCTNPDPLSHE